MQISILRNDELGIGFHSVNKQEINALFRDLQWRNWGAPPKVVECAEIKVGKTEIIFYAKKTK